MEPNVSDSKIPGSAASGSDPRASEASRPSRYLTRREFLRSAWARSCGAVLAFLTGLGIDALWARLVRGPGLARTDYPRFVVAGWRVHHSVVGYLAVVLGMFALPGVLIPLGLGIIVGHARRDRLGFLERLER